VSRRDFNYDGKHNDDRRQLDESVFSSGLHNFELPSPNLSCVPGLGLVFVAVAAVIFITARFSNGVAFGSQTHDNGRSNEGH
jgi:hypothetical protein